MPSSASFGSPMKYRPTRSARPSSSAEKYSLMTCGGVPLKPDACWPEACPITSCMSVCSSPARVPYFDERSASSGDQENSPRSEPGVDLSYASEMFDSDTDLLPCC